MYFGGGVLFFMSLFDSGTRTDRKWERQSGGTGGGSKQSEQPAATQGTCCSGLFAPIKQCSLSRSAVRSPHSLQINMVLSSLKPAKLWNSLPMQLLSGLHWTPDNLLIISRGAEWEKDGNKPLTLEWATVRIQQDDCWCFYHAIDAKLIKTKRIRISNILHENVNLEKLLKHLIQAAECIRHLLPPPLSRHLNLLLLWTLHTLRISCWVLHMLKAKSE